MENIPVMKINNLRVEFPGEAGVLKAVDGVSLAIRQGEVLSLVGESGCGKSMTALSILRLVPAPGRITSGEIWWGDEDLLHLPVGHMTRLRGKDMGIIFQAIELHLDYPPEAARELAIESLARVGLPDPARQFEVYPHELSGGMRQRAMIAMALICNPKLLIADEPTTALDVTIQAQILELLRTLQAQNGMSVLLITHNLGIVAETATRVAVMYAGKLVETAATLEIFKNPLHPYTQGLLESIPRIDGGGSLYAIPGSLPDPFNLPTGCYFAPRCPRAMEVCREKVPELTFKSQEHEVACWLYEA